MRQSSLLRAPTRACWVPFPRAKARAGDDSGFTLLEIVVALAILGLSLSVLFGIFSQSIARKHANDVRADERAFADTLLTQAMRADITPISGAGRYARHLVWKIDVAPFGNAEDTQAWPQQLEQVTVKVWRDDVPVSSPVTLRTLRAVPKVGTPS